MTEAIPSRRDMGERGKAPRHQSEPVKILAELRAAAVELDDASEELAGLMRQAEGYIAEDGEFIEGVSLRYRIAVEAEKIRLYDEAIEAGKRPPGEDIRTAKAEAKVRAEQPGLAAEYAHLQTSIAALRMWISARKESISARQSVLKGERG